jgi:hypothetical protein
MLYELRVIVITNEHIECNVFNIITMVVDLRIPVEMNLVVLILKQGAHKGKRGKNVAE